VHKPDCLFCKIVQGDIPAQMVYQDDKVTAFRDIAPQAPVHILVIPNLHLTDLLAIDEPAHRPYWEAMLQAVQKVSKVEPLGQGFRVVVNNGPDAGQAVGHLHFHLLGGRRMSWPPG
jgi:histidine triad (HIT) family protein